MEIVVKSKSKVRKDFIENTAKFYAKHLGLEKSRYKLNIYSMPNLIKEGNNGLCAKTGDKQISIAIDSRLGVIKLLYTLAHEMVHVKQFAKGHYKQESKKGVTHHYWMGKKVIADYIKRPWEIEAFSRESLLVEVLSDQVYKKSKRKK